MKLNLSSVRAAVLAVALALGLGAVEANAQTAWTETRTDYGKLHEAVLGAGNTSSGVLYLRPDDSKAEFVLLVKGNKAGATAGGSLTIAGYAKTPTATTPSPTIAAVAIDGTNGYAGVLTPVTSFVTAHLSNVSGTVNASYTVQVMEKSRKQ